MLRLTPVRPLYLQYVDDGSWRSLAMLLTQVPPYRSVEEPRMDDLAAKIVDLTDPAATPPVFTTEAEADAWLLGRERALGLGAKPIMCCLLGQMRKVIRPGDQAERKASLVQHVAPPSLDADTWAITLPNTGVSGLAALSVLFWIRSGAVVEVPFESELLFFYSDGSTEVSVTGPELDRIKSAFLAIYEPGKPSPPE